MLDTSYSKSTTNKKTCSFNNNDISHGGAAVVEVRSTQTLAPPIELLNSVRSAASEHQLLV